MIDLEIEFAAYILSDFLLIVTYFSVTKAVLKCQDRRIIFKKIATYGIGLTPIAVPDKEECVLPIRELIEMITITEFGLTVLCTRKENTSSDAVKHVPDCSFSNQVATAGNMQNSELKEARN
jgi:hypothetical protein